MLDLLKVAKTEDSIQYQVYLHKKGKYNRKTQNWATENCFSTTMANLVGKFFIDQKVMSEKKSKIDVSQQSQKKLISRLYINSQND